MTSGYSFHQGDSPLLVSVPHDGRRLPADVAERMTAAGLALPDTDWSVGRLYEFVRNMNASVIAADFSRYVVDLNRSSADEPLYENQKSTGLCPERTFGGDEIYQVNQGPDSVELRRRVEEYWRPYHGKLQQTLGEIQAEFGYALLWDAHSIQGVVPALFDGELPDLNIGSNGGSSCHAEITAAVAGIAYSSTFSSVLNGRFRGGFITRHYGRPEQGVCALQLELAQRCYMDEKTLGYDSQRAATLERTVKNMMTAYVETADSVFRH